MRSRDVGRYSRHTEDADVDQRHGDTPRDEQIADVPGLTAFRVERGEEEN